MAAIFGEENHTRAGAQENAVRVMRIIGEAANIASVRPQRGPLSGPCGAGAAQRKYYKKQRFACHKML